jgi:hypothetical protein
MNPSTSKAVMLGDDLQPWHARMEQLMAARTRIIALRGAGSVGGIDPRQAVEAVNAVIHHIEANAAAGTPVALLYDGDPDNPDKPDVGWVFGRIAQAYAHDPMVTFLAAQTEGWYDSPTLEAIASADGTPYETYVFDDAVPGGHASLTQSDALVHYSCYEQVFVGAVGPIAHSQLEDLSAKAMTRTATQGPVPVLIIRAGINANLDSVLSRQLDVAEDAATREKIAAKITQRRSFPYGSFFAADGSFSLGNRQYPPLHFEVAAI